MPRKATNVNFGDTTVPQDVKNGPSARFSWPQGGEGVSTALSGVQRLVLEGFPSPLLARSLSPNGRVHWGVRDKARRMVQIVVVAEVQRSGMRPAAGPLQVTFRYIRPTRGRVDLDNLSTGVSKACLDSLVRAGVLVDDDSRHVVELRAEAVYEKGRRALEIILEGAA